MLSFVEEFRAGFFWTKTTEFDGSTLAPAK